MTKQKSKEWWEKHKLRLLLLGLFLVGALLVLLFEDRGALPFKYGEHLGMAIAISGFLGFVIEYALHRELARNVFEAAIGYLLHEELRGELKWIYDQPLLCETHVQSTKITEIGNGLVSVRSTLLRMFRNISNKPYSVHVGLGVSEWFYEGRASRVISLTYQVDGEAASENLAPRCIRKADGWGGPDEQVSINPEQRVTLSHEWEEVLPRNGWTFITFGTPTVNPSVVVDWPDSLVADVRFDHRQNPVAIRKGERTWRLEGVLLPHQDIRIHWYRKADSDAWLPSGGPTITGVVPAG